MDIYAAATSMSSSDLSEKEMMPNTSVSESNAFECNMEVAYAVSEKTQNQPECETRDDAMVVPTLQQRRAFVSGTSAHCLKALNSTVLLDQNVHEERALSEQDRISIAAEKLRTRLKYALFKVKRGWEHLPLETVEELLRMVKKQQQEVDISPLEALGLAAGIVSAKSELEAEVVASSSAPSPSVKAEDVQSQMAAIALQSIVSKKGALYETYREHFSRKVVPNLSEFASGLWDRYLNERVEYERSNPQTYGMLGKPILSYERIQRVLKEHEKQQAQLQLNKMRQLSYLSNELLDKNVFQHQQQQMLFLHHHQQHPKQFSQHNFPRQQPKHVYSQNIRPIQFKFHSGINRTPLLENMQQARRRYSEMPTPLQQPQAKARRISYDASAVSPHMRSSPFSYHTTPESVTITPPGHSPEVLGDSTRSLSVHHEISPLPPIKQQQANGTSSFSLPPIHDSVKQRANSLKLSPPLLHSNIQQQLPTPPNNTRECQ